MSNEPVLAVSELCPRQSLSESDCHLETSAIWVLLACNKTRSYNNPMSDPQLDRLIRPGNRGRADGVLAEHPARGW